MLYATSTATALAAVAVETARSTSARMSAFQSPSHLAWGCPAILSICKASAGRVVRHESAVRFASELGFTYSARLASGFVDEGGAGGGGGGLRFLCFEYSKIGEEPSIGSGDVTSRQADTTVVATTRPVIAVRRRIASCIFYCGEGEEGGKRQTWKRNRRVVSSAVTLLS